MTKVSPKFCSSVLSEKHSNSRDEQKDTKEVKNEIKALDQSDAEPDDEPPHDQSAENSPDQNSMLGAGRNLKVGEDKNENEDVIYAEGIFDEIAGQKIEALYPARAVSKRAG